MTKMKILVSGVAGDIGLGIGRILKDWSLFDKIYGIDIYDDHPAKLIFDEIEICPKADNSSYIDWLCNFLLKKKINLFVPTSEAEIFVINRNLQKINQHTKVLINDKLVVNKSLDKWETLNFLTSKGIAVPSNGIVGQDMPSKFPVIVKPRRGQGSKGLKKIKTKLEFKKCSKKYVWQDCLRPYDQEYTCAVYVSKNIDMKILIMKRSLLNGYTEKAIVVKNKKIRDYISSIVKAFNKPGCYNIQLTLTKEGPRIFEINPRFSSTVVFRDKLGFYDLKWWISEYLNIEFLHHEDVIEGTKIYRGNTEYIIKPETKKKRLFNQNKIFIDTKINIKLEKIIPSKDQINILYHQLEKRLHNISHKVFPQFKEHEYFVKNNPYRVWFVIRRKFEVIGNIYAQFDNSIGLSLDENINSHEIQKILNLFCSKLRPLKSKPSSRGDKYFINLPSSNISLQKKLNSIKCKEIQRSYILPDYLFKSVKK